MNKERRKQCDELAQKAQSIWSDADDLKSEIEEVLDAEREAFDAMPESLQQGERGQQMEEALGHLADALKAAEQAADSLTDISGFLEEAKQ